MGEAQRRGTFESRKAESIEQQRKLDAAHSEIRRRRGKSVTPIFLAALAAMVIDGNHGG